MTTVPLEDTAVLEDAAVQEIVDEVIKEAEGSEGQDQTVKSEEVNNKDAQVGEVKKEAGTATAEEKVSTEDTGLETEKKDEGLTPEEIMSGKKPDAGISKEKGLSLEAQERINGKINRAIKEKKIAQEETRKVRQENEQLKNVQDAPQEKPLVPDRDLFETTEKYQEAYGKYQDDLKVYNDAQDTLKFQIQEAETQVQESNDRLIDQMEELKTRFPDGVKLEGKMVDVAEIISKTDYGYAKRVISNNKNNAKLGLYLAMHPSERIRIGSIADPEDRGVAIGELSALFNPSKNKTTSAPSELNTLKGDTGGEAGDEITDAEIDKMSKDYLEI